MSNRRSPGQHKDPLAGHAVAIPQDQRPTPGPITVLPEPVGKVVEAIEAGGGEVSGVSAETRGIVWLSHTHAPELVKVLDANPQVEWVQLPWAGVEKFADVFERYATRDRLLWTSAKSSYSEPVAEHALALILATLRQLPQKIRSSSWATTKQGISLYGRNVVIIGAGGIAVELLGLLEPFEVTTTVVRRTQDKLPGADRTVTADRLAEVLPDADVVVIAAAATSGTARLIGKGELALLRPSAVLVNIARGTLVDTDALTETLANGSLYGAGLDVTDPEPLPDGHPLWSEPRCIISSHTADTPEMTAPLLAERIRFNVEAFVSGSGRFIGSVDTKEGY